MPDPAVRTEELRLALVMNGGVSLAVWIGGVSAEIARAVREIHPVYKNLLELTRTRARVDVIAGASAGGINGAALALALEFGTDLSQMRDLWREKGALTALLRSPSEHDPPSLLDGDGYFLPALQYAFEGLRNARQSRDVPMRLVLTTTLLHARIKVITDDLGTAIQDAEHRGRFLFNQEHFKNPEITRQLAFASRATSSFPVAFEPAYCKVEKETVPATPLEPDNYREIVNFQDSRFLIDGGVLDNKPFEEALKQVFSLSADGQIRRVLAYIAPDPGITAQDGPDKPDEKPSLGEVGMAGAFSIPAAQTIAGQIGRIKDHNAYVRRTRQEAVEIMKILNAQKGTPVGPAAIPAAFFDAYSRHRIAGAVEYVLDLIEASPPKDKGQKNDADKDKWEKERARRAFGRRTRAWVKDLLIAHYPEKDIGDQARWVPIAWPQRSFETGEDVRKWEWGLYCVEYFARILIDLLRRSERMMEVLTLQTAVRGAPVLSESSSQNPGFDDPDAPRLEVAPALKPGYLQLFWQAAFILNDEIKGKRDGSGEMWKSRGEALFEQLAKSSPDDSEWLVTWLRESVKPDPARTQILARTGFIALRIAALIRGIRKEMATHESSLQTLAGGSRPEAGEAASLLVILEYFKCTNAKAALDRLIYIEVTQYAIGDRPQDHPDIAVELVQISGWGKSPFPGTPDLANKLAGLQLGHFAAFYKKSWRANDWMHGRLDGSEKLVRILLNPERLHRLYAGINIGGKTGSQVVAEQIKRIAVDTVPGLEAKRYLEANWNQDEVEGELEFLNDVTSRIPESLDRCCDAITSRLHLGILASEIPVVAESVQSDQSEGADAHGVGADLVREYAFSVSSPEKFVRLWQTRSLGRERVGQEFGSDLMTRVLSHTLAVSQSVVSSTKAELGPLRLLTGSLQLPVKMFYLFANQLLRDSKTASAVAVGLTSVGLLLIGLRLLVKDFPETLGTFGWAVAAAGLVMVIVRAQRAFLGFVLLSALLASGFLSSDYRIALLLATALLFGIWKLPALCGPLIVLTAAAFSIGHSGRDAAWFELCRLQFVRNIFSSCAMAATPKPDEIERVWMVGASAAAIVIAWLAWVLGSVLIRIDRSIRAGLGWLRRRRTV